VTRNEAAAGYVEEELRALGYRPNVEKDNVWFETGEGPACLLLNSHLDTVSWGRVDPRPVRRPPRRDKVYGRGASDCKGNIAAMLEIARLAKGERSASVFFSPSRRRRVRDDAPEKGAISWRSTSGPTRPSSSSRSST